MYGSGMIGISKRSRLALLALAGITVLAGIALRLVSFGWNDRLHGDVNLFALTAREFVLHDRLYYPMKFEYSDFVEYRVLQSPASQHPPLWPLLGGLLAKVLTTEDTFKTLKILCEVVGILLIVIGACFGLRAGRIREAIIIGAIVALSPMLVDFSANGSSYILSALILVLAVLLLGSFDHDRLYHYAFGGILCGIGILVHSALACLPLAFIGFWLWDRSQVKWRGVVAFAAAGLVTISPWLLWNYLHFGRPLYSYSTNFLLGKLGLAHTGIYDDVITTRMTGSVDGSVPRAYMERVLITAHDFGLAYWLVVGPFCLILAATGCVSMFRRSIREAVSFALPFLFYVIVVVLWATFKFRFLVPTLLAAYIAAAVGFVKLWEGNHVALRLLGVVCLVGTLAWGVPRFFDATPTMYYSDDDLHAHLYGRMLSLVDELKDQEPGVVLGVAPSLDGGFETVYWLGWPFVYGRGLDVPVVQKLVDDFGVRYIWSDQATTIMIESTLSTLPNARRILSNDAYQVFELRK